MNIFARTLGAGAVALMIGSGGAQAAGWIFVGSWQVDDGPSWAGVPTAYSGIDAAALLFGGSAANYAISTVDDMVANIDNLAWVSTWGGACGGASPCGTQIAENAVTSTGGLYQTSGDTSAYVNDWAIGAEYTNYAFRADVPLPAAAPLFAVALAGLGIAAGRRRKA